jgi:membrane-bound metal-dependent hydrolase YbcI (DUF457 family)
VFIEHLVFAAAIAVLAGMIFSLRTGRDPSWIIIAVAFIPDLDLPLQKTGEALHLPAGMYIQHGDFHTIGMLAVISLLIAFIVMPLGIRFSEALICSATGLGTHFLEDALVANPAYAFLFPFSVKDYGVGILPWTRDVFGIANSLDLAIAVIFLLAAILVRSRVEGRGWWRRFLAGGIDRPRSWVVYGK